MCGRYNLNATPRFLIRQFRLVETQFDLFPRYNIAPTQTVLIVRQNAETKQRELASVRWGLIPSWAKDETVGNRMLNTRAETAAEKPGFRSAMKNRRCIVPASGFYEWQKQGAKVKQAFNIHRRDGELLALAGLWEQWTSPDGELVESCTILTTDANDLMRPIHDRMTLILAESDYDRWLDATNDAAAVADLLKPCPSEWLVADPVGSYVNSVRNEGEMCVAPDVPKARPDVGLFG